ncbi:MULTISPECIES: transglycosylase domain-containing protein [unclassified Flavobacterium]|uniref:transglycosylase domain-containing protein n=1 Tax=unclassified Flavobacterium TaxID=196869 RepID=UPI0021109F8A|nr:MULTISPECIES: transglycosylase domain-containing protein [unclassified Flavobacterium]
MRNTSLLKRALYLLKIKKEFSHDECLKFVLVHYDFGFDNIGIKDASKFYFKKDLEKLNEKQIITLVVIFRNSGLYNPIQNKKKLDAKVLLFEKILHNK